MQTEQLPILAFGVMFVVVVLGLVSMFQPG
jgi:hypothetical protein